MRQQFRRFLATRRPPVNKEAVRDLLAAEHEARDKQAEEQRLMEKARAQALEDLAARQFRFLDPIQRERRIAEFHAKIRRSDA